MIKVLGSVVIPLIMKFKSVQSPATTVIRTATCKRAHLNRFYLQWHSAHRCEGVIKARWLDNETYLVLISELKSSCIQTFRRRGTCTGQWTGVDIISDVEKRQTHPRNIWHTEQRSLRTKHLQALFFFPEKTMAY